MSKCNKTCFFPNLIESRYGYTVLLLEEALEKSGNDLDSAIKNLNELSLGYVNGASGSPAQSNVKATVTASEGVSLENSSAGENIPKNGAEWVELFVT
ncbi:hypothetical protein L1987_14648 [Smallanthus sonchifolius]|uniref:Uncharacterized protein n=1 Tax=Smallanthus sonchifolius TaxID=185202 RepID=A0ACB9J5P2_9ASTR|nr:hypothetical protein L1987_14648 [Smallanthus sonchifolius]